MALDEQLRELANRVPPPPPGDATDVFRRGRRRRRARHAVTVTAAVSVVAVLGVGVASLLDAEPRLPDIADQPDRDAADGSPLPVPEPGSALPAELDDGTPVFVSHLADGEIVVLDATSPHQDITLVAHCTRNGGFEDVRHGSRFTADGLWLGGPAPSGLAVYPHIRAGSDHVQVTGPATAQPRSDSERLPETFDHGPYCFGTETGDHPADAVYHLPGEPPSDEQLTLQPGRWQWTHANFEVRDDTLVMCAQVPCSADALEVPVPHEGWLTSFERVTPDLLVLARPHGDARAEIRLPALDARAVDRVDPDLEAVFATHPVRPCTEDAEGWAVRDLSGWQDDGPPTRTRLEAGVDLRDHRPELDRHAQIVGTEPSLEVIEIVLLDPTREALDAIARVTDPQRVCITPANPPSDSRARRR